MAKPVSRPRGESSLRRHVAYVQLLYSRAKSARALGEEARRLRRENGALKRQMARYEGVIARYRRTLTALASFERRDAKVVHSKD